MRDEVLLYISEDFSYGVARENGRDPVDAIESGQAPRLLKDGMPLSAVALVAGTTSVNGIALEELLSLEG
jgi:hypothetical protein